MAIYTHTPAEVATLEGETGLELLCWIHPGRGGLVPVLGRRGGPAARQRDLALRLNDRRPAAAATTTPAFAQEQPALAE